MIVPLSLTFAKKYAVLRTHLYKECNTIWFSSFGRIPSALFSFDTRVRNTIYLGYKSPTSSKRYFTTRLHRWFNDQRPTLFDGLKYSPFSPEAFDGLIPKIGSERLVKGFEQLLTTGNYRFQNELVRTHGAHQLHFKKTAYNWLTFCVKRPPAYDSSNRLIQQPEYGVVYFQGSDNRDLSLLLLNGKLCLAWWIAIGDDFHLTKRAFASAPFGPKQLSRHQRQQLVPLMSKLGSAMSDNLVFKLNAGKNIGNYNLAKCRHITDMADKILLEALELPDLWDEIELEYALVVKTPFARDTNF